MVQRDRWWPTTNVRSRLHSTMMRMPGTPLDDSMNPWGLTPYTARALVHLAEGGAVTDDVSDLVKAAQAFLAQYEAHPADVNQG